MFIIFKKFSKLVSVLIFTILLISCKNESLIDTNISNPDSEIKDSIGNTIVFENPPTKVVAVGSSLGDIWISSGGQIKGITSDAFDGRDLALDTDDIEIIGTIKDPNVELVISMQPDLVLLSQDIKSHISMIDILEKSNLPYYIVKLDTFEDYLYTLKSFTKINKRPDLYIKNGLDIKNNIDKIKSVAITDKPPTVLFLRSFSSSTKVIARDNFVCEIIDDLKAINIAKDNNSPLEELTMEAIIEKDPDFILLVTMGSEEKSFIPTPAWNNLKAIKNNRFIILPKDLFHYKPNSRWDESYDYLFKVLYPKNQ